MSFENKPALIVGGSSGMGLEAGQLLTEAGAAVTLVGRVGDEAAASTLTAWAHATSVDWMRVAALDSAARIRTRGREPGARPTPGEVPDVERLEERMKDLEERLRRLEEWRY